ncbi:MAG TPA: DUF3365 domain-containing protein [Membranihabitans sp.]|nr:DUF3365 domain-containing protein [Membranihabitans sp.]
MFKGVLIIAAMMIFIACSQKSSELSDEEMDTYIQRGDSIALNTQAVLMQNVAKAIQQGGTEYAVEFCNTRALPLTDSVAGHMNVRIQRLSDKNRNPANSIQTTLDSLAWDRIQSGNDKVLEQDEKGDVYYYKPISIAMPTCLKCHGGNAEISESTQAVIAAKYPDDKATGYRQGDLRGMWKIQWVRELE